jgi:AcrR family transcriptional regulator
MSDADSSPPAPPPPADQPPVNRVGRPRRGTESARTATLIDAATRVFLREGYGLCSIDKVASEAGVSTRTIYERFKNKADLLGGVISHLVDRDITSVLAESELASMELRQALTVIGETIAARVSDPDSAALFRIVATEAQRFPALADKMRRSTKVRIDDLVARYFRTQITRGTLAVSDADTAASMFMQLVVGELHDCLLFGNAEALATFDATAHVRRVVDLFLYGAAPRGDRPTSNPE